MTIDTKALDNADAAMAAISQPTEPEFPPASAVVDDRCGECGEFESECECLPTVEPELIADHGLIECPHCGKSPIVTLHPAHKHTGPLADFMPEVGDTYTAECCGGMIDDSLDDLREKWNRRATAAQKSGDGVGTDAVDRFAAAMREKMAASRAKGRGGWDDPAVCCIDDLWACLLQHVGKGDLVDVGNYAMMIWHRLRREEGQQ